MTFHRFSPSLLGSHADRGDIAQSLARSPMLICSFFCSYMSHSYSHMILSICLYWLENKRMRTHKHSYIYTARKGILHTPGKRWAPLQLIVHGEEMEVNALFLFYNVKRVLWGKNAKPCKNDRGFIYASLFRILSMCFLFQVTRLKALRMRTY